MTTCRCCVSATGRKHWKKWIAEGHLPAAAIGALADGSEADDLVGKKLGFDYNYQTMCYLGAGIQPVFTREVVETKPDGSRIVRNESGALIVEKDGAGSIPMEVGHTLVDRASWEKEFLPRLQWSDSRADEALINSLKAGDTQRQIPARPARGQPAWHYPRLAGRGGTVLSLYG